MKITTMFTDAMTMDNIKVHNPIPVKFVQVGDSYYYYDKPEQQRKLYFAKCIHEMTFWSFVPNLKISAKSFNKLIIGSATLFLILGIVGFSIAFKSLIPFGFSIFTVFYSTIAFFYFTAIYALYRKAFTVYGDDPKYIKDFMAWQDEVLKRDAFQNPHNRRPVREILYKALEADSVVDLYFKDLTATAYRKAYTVRLLAVLGITGASVFVALIEYIIKF